MKILLTGASSFTGAWFAWSLVNAGHDVVGTLQSRRGDYIGVRCERVGRLLESGVRLVESCAFGDESFIGEVSRGYDILCHHGATVRNYKSPDFDVDSAVAANTKNIRAALVAAKSAGMQSVVLTGSVFEADEGAGTSPLRAVSPYGLSKTLTSQVFSYWTEAERIPLYKFVIPNPFGPWEEPRFCAYLMQCWAKGDAAHVNTPSYVRDNIHVDLLADEYVAFVERAGRRETPQRVNPSGYIETQGMFAKRFADEIGSRLRFPARIVLKPQTDFLEPLVRINTDPPAGSWDEGRAWDELARYYEHTYLREPAKGRGGPASPN